MNPEPRYSVKMHHNKFVSVCNHLGYSTYVLNDNLAFLNESCNSQLAKKIHGEIKENVKIVEPLYLFNNDIIALIINIDSKNDYLEIMDGVKKEKLISIRKIPTPVLSCTSNVDKLLICSENWVYIFTLIIASTLGSGIIYTMKPTPHKVYTVSNPDGIFAFRNNLLVFPQESDPRVFKILRIAQHQFIASHRSPHTEHVSAIALNHDESYIASTSKSGKLIHVYSCTTIDDEPVYIFERGTSSANITCLSFSNDSKFLGCISDGKTVHIFKLSEEAKQQHKGRSIKETAEGAFYTVQLQSKAEQKSNLIVKSSDSIDLIVITDKGELQLYSCDESSARGSNMERKWLEPLNVEEPPAYRCNLF